MLDTLTMRARKASARLEALFGEARAALAGHDRAGLACSRFAGILEDSREPAEVHVALVRIAHELTGASLVELWHEGEGQACRVACWPMTSQDEPAEPAGDWLRLPVRGGGRQLGTLRLHAEAGRGWPPSMVRALTTLTAMAAVAELAARADHYDEPLHKALDGLHNGPFLDTFVSYAVAQAQRRHESLSLLYIDTDRLAAIERMLGPESASRAVRRVAKAVLGTLRVSDVVGRLEDGRLIAILPDASAEDAMNVAEGVRVAVAEAGGATETMPALTVSVGVATYPDHAHDVPTLRASAASALVRAQTQGRNRIAGNPPNARPIGLALATCAG